MEKMDYITGLKHIHNQIGLDEIIAFPMVLPNGMADLWLPEKDIEIMRIAMKSSCASMLLTQVKNMHGNEQDYQNQKALLMNEAYLGETHAHRVLVGLWAMVGKDADKRGNKTQQSKENLTKNAETERSRFEDQITEQSRNENTIAQERWGHSKLYYLLMFIAEFLIISLGLSVSLEAIFATGFQESSVDEMILAFVTSIALFVFAHVLDRKDKWHIRRSQTMLLTAGHLLPRGTWPWTTYYIKLMCWSILLVLSIAVGLGLDSTWAWLIDIWVFSALAVSFIDAYFDRDIHKYLNETSRTPDNLE